MEFHQIRYFLAASDHMNFTRAAETSGVSQPALTVAIRKLEEELGGPLFHRDGRGISLTELGRTMRTHLARIEETRQIAGRAAQAALAPDSGVLDVGIFSTIGPSLIGPAIEAFSHTAPDVELVLYDIWGMKAYDLLLSGAFDCAIVARHTELPARVLSTPLMQEPMELGVCVSDPIAGRASADLRDLDGITYLDRLRCEFREPILAAMQRLGVKPRTKLRSESDSWIVQAVTDGNGVTIGPRSVLTAPGVATLPISGTDFSRQIEFATVEGRVLSPVAQRFADFIATFDWPQSRSAQVRVTA